MATSEVEERFHLFSLLLGLVIVKRRFIALDCAEWSVLAKGKVPFQCGLLEFSFTCCQTIPLWVKALRFHTLGKGLGLI